jgi:PhzF family phenazine biosynthesis protein
MRIPIYHVDAFTDELFKGNPAAVCILDRWPSDSLMQSIAFENNLSETAFVVRRGKAFGLRWFTPKVEVDLCGHATLASAHVLFEHLGYGQDEIRFLSTRSGTLKVSRKGEELVMDFPADSIRRATTPPALVEGLGKKPQETWRGRTDCLAVYGSQNDIERMNPDFKHLLKVKTRGIIVTSAGDRTDFVSRFFGPRVGVDEDPVTGSAHTTLAVYWAPRLKKAELTALQLSKRRGSLRCRLCGDRVKIAGKARTFSIGEIHV